MTVTELIITAITIALGGGGGAVLLQRLIPSVDKRSDENTTIRAELRLERDSMRKRVTDLEQAVQERDTRINEMERTHNAAIAALVRENGDLHNIVADLQRDVDYWKSRFSTMAMELEELKRHAKGTSNGN